MWPFSKSLAAHLGETKMVRAKGIKFKIKKLNVANHLEGLNVLVETYSTYEKKRLLESQPVSQQDSKAYLAKVQSVYKEIFLSSVVWPKLTRTTEEEGQFVDDLFGDWDLCHALYEQIMLYSVKKKVKNAISLNQKSAKLIL